MKKADTLDLSVMDDPVLGCVNVPKVIKCMLHGAQLMSLVINDSPSEKNLKILHFLIWTKAFEVYLLSYVVAVPEKKVFA